MHRQLGALAVVGALAASALAMFASPPAAAGGQVLVVIETGAGHVSGVVVPVDGASIHGIVALQEAVAQLTGVPSSQQQDGGELVTLGFGGLGVAVCKVLGVGNAATSRDCLGNGGSFWAYFHAGAGTCTFGLSPVGAGASVVHAGDVEGWRFGGGAAPPFETLPRALGQPDPCGPPTSPTGGSAASGPAAPGARGHATASGATGPGQTGASPGPASVPTTAASASPPSTPASDGRTGASVLGRGVHRSIAPRDTSSGGPPLSLLGFGAALVVLAVAIGLARRARRARARSIAP